MNDAEIDLIVQECQRAVGMRVTQVWQPARDRLYLGWDGAPCLLLVPRGPFARLHFQRDRPRNPQQPYSFQGFLRAHLAGALLRVERTTAEREVTFQFPTGRLLLRLTGRSGGLWWIAEGAGRPEASIDGPCDALPPLAARPDRRDERVRFALEGGPFAASAGAEAYFAREEQREQIANRQRSILGRATAQRKRLQRLTAHLLDDVDKGERAATLRRQADALGAALFQIPRGAHRVEVRDLLDDTPHTLILDPRESAGKHMDRLYQRARRLDTVARRASERWEAAHGALAVLEGLLARCQASDAQDSDWTALSAALPPARVTVAQRAATDWDVWSGPGGVVALVGKHERGNRRLCFQVARAGDWWMHARERPGPHVILRMGRHQTPSLDILLTAAQLALSGLRIAPGQAADVQYARANQLRSVPGGPHAHVTVRDERVLRVVRVAGPPPGWICEADLDADGPS